MDKFRSLSYVCTFLTEREHLSAKADALLPKAFVTFRYGAAGTVLQGHAQVALLTVVRYPGISVKLSAPANSKDQTNVCCRRSFRGRGGIICEA